VARLRLIKVRGEEPLAELILRIKHKARAKRKGKSK
jgi:hypothetical protein